MTIWCIFCQVIRLVVVFVGVLLYAVTGLPVLCGGDSAAGVCGPGVSVLLALVIQLLLFAWWAELTYQCFRCFQDQEDAAPGKRHCFLVFGYDLALNS